MRIILLGLSLALFSTAITAQNEQKKDARTASTKPQPEHYAGLRAQAYNDALDLTKEQLANMNEVFLQGEQSVIDLRIACLEAQAKIESMMRVHERKAEGILTKDQQAKLLELRKSGDFNAEVPSCMPATMGGCKHSAACCAGGKKEVEEKKPERVQPRIQQAEVPEISAPE